MLRKCFMSAVFFCWSWCLLSVWSWQQWAPVTVEGSVSLWRWPLHLQPSVCLLWIVFPGLEPFPARAAAVSCLKLTVEGFFFLFFFWFAFCSHISNFCPLHSQKKLSGLVLNLTAALFVVEAVSEICIRRRKRQQYEFWDVLREKRSHKRAMFSERSEKGRTESYKSTIKNCLHVFALD